MTGCIEPPGPILPVVDVNEWKSEDVRRLDQAMAPSQELGTAHGEEILGAQAGDVEARPIAVAMTYGEVHVLACEVDVVQGCRHAQIDGRVVLGKTAQAVDEPFGRKVRRRADGEDARALPLEQTLGADRDAVESVAQHGEILAARLRDDEALALAIEELDAQLELQSLHLVAHRPLRHAQLLGGAREALVPGRSLESLERIEGRKTAEHRTLLHEKN
jgi:hypothetical protein